MSITTRVQSPSLLPLADAATARAAKVIFEELYGRFQAAMGAQAWEWPNETERRDASGKVREVVGSPRNIVNLGTLRASGNFRMTGRSTAVFEWAAQYAAATHEGARLRNGGIIPPRPWTDVVIGRIQGTGSVPVYPMAQRAAEVWLRYFRA